MTSGGDGTPAADPETVVLRSDDPRLPGLLTDGFEVVGESWGARLRLDDEPDLRRTIRAVERARTAGAWVGELETASADRLLALERANHADYPVTPATAHEEPSAEGIAALWRNGGRVFGVELEGELVAATATTRDGGTAETGFTSVLAAHRRRGFGAAAKAASILALAGEGVRVFGTGGAAVNAGSIGVNESLGYVLEERWLSLARRVR